MHGSQYSQTQGNLNILNNQHKKVPWILHDESTYFYWYRPQAVSPQGINCAIWQSPLPQYLTLVILFFFFFFRSHENIFAFDIIPRHGCEKFAPEEDKNMYIVHSQYHSC